MVGDYCADKSLTLKFNPVPPYSTWATTQSSVLRRCKTVHKYSGTRAKATLRDCAITSSSLVAASEPCRFSCADLFIVNRVQRLLLRVESSRKVVGSGRVICCVHPLETLEVAQHWAADWHSAGRCPESTHLPQVSVVTLQYFSGWAYCWHLVQQIALT